MNLIDHPSEFKQGVRVVMRVLRSKDGGLGKPDHHATKIITTNEQEWKAAVVKLAQEASGEERIYSCVDARDWNKAIHEFKRRQLDADLYDDKAKLVFYLDLKNRFIGSLMTPSSRKTKYFLFDCDSLEDYERCFASEDVRNNMIHQYSTKNGYHVITKPFNPSLAAKAGINPDNVKKNALMLVGY